MYSIIFSVSAMTICNFLYLFARNFFFNCSHWNTVLPILFKCIYFRWLKMKKNLTLINDHWSYYTNAWISNSDIRIYDFPNYYPPHVYYSIIFSWLMILENFRFFWIEQLLLFLFQSNTYTNTYRYTYI